MNTCIESTARFGIELDYKIVLAKGATAGISWEDMNASHDINAPKYAHHLLDTKSLSKIIN